jgi:hypothetical protein
MRLRAVSSIPIARDGARPSFKGFSRNGPISSFFPHSLALHKNGRPEHRQAAAQERIDSGASGYDNSVQIAVPICAEHAYRMRAMGGLSEYAISQHVAGVCWRSALRGCGSSRAKCRSERRKRNRCQSVPFRWTADRQDLIGNCVIICAHCRLSLTVHVHTSDGNIDDD